MPYENLLAKILAGDTTVDTTWFQAVDVQRLWSSSVRDCDVGSTTILCQVTLSLDYLNLELFTAESAYNPNPNQLTLWCTMGKKPSHLDGEEVIVCEANVE